MTDNPLVMGVDIGTSGCKTVLVDAEGAVAARAFEEYPLYNERHGWSEQDPEDWWQAVRATVRTVVEADESFSNRLVGIGLTGQMHGLVALDENNAVLRRSILWNDQRTEKQCRWIESAAGGLGALLSITNNPMLPGYTGGKIVWVREEEPETYSRIRHFLNPKDYVRLRLTGVHATEVSDASGTGLFDVKNRRWAAELFELVDIPLEWAPPAYESTEISARLSESVAADLGLHAGVPVVGGGGDAVIQTLGTGVVSSTTLMTTLGTSGIVSTALEEFKDNPQGRIQVFCNVIPGTWHAMGVTLSAGASLQWARNRFGHAEREIAEVLGSDPYEIISEEASRAAPGAGGLVFLPYLSGERCPYPDPKARGVFAGLSHGTTKAEIYRSIMEGVVLSLRDAGSIFDDIGMTFGSISTSGGGAQSPLWRQIHADVFQKPVVTVSGSREGAAYGAAVVAGVGTGHWPDFDHAVAALEVETITDPDASLSDTYDRLYEIYHGLYATLKPTFDALSAFG